MDAQNLTDEYVNAATEAVNDRLRIGGFIDRHLDQILDKVEQAADKTQGQEEFLGEVFPIIDSVIHVGAIRSDYMRALPWADEKRPRTADAHGWLTLLTLVYIAREGYSKRSKDLAKASTWDTIMNRVDTLLSKDRVNRGQKTDAGTAPSLNNKGTGAWAQAEHSGRRQSQGRPGDQVSATGNKAR